MIYTAQQFSDDAGISVDLAKKILDMLYAQNLGAEDLNSMIWRARDWVITNKLPDLMEKLTDEELTTLLNQMIVERAMYRAPYDICCAETPEKFKAALDRTDHPSSMRFFTEMKFSEAQKKQGDIVTIQVMRTGTWDHALYGEVKVTKATLTEVKKNFDDDVRGIQIAVDENHEDNHAALGWYKELFFEPGDEDNLFAKVELTQAGADKVNDGSYKYFSPEIAFQWVDEETGASHTNLLIGGAFTNRPFFKGMKPLQLSESASASGQGTPASGMTLFLFTSPDSMQKYLELAAKFTALKTLTVEQGKALTQAYNEVPQKFQTGEISRFFAELSGRVEGGEAAGADAPVLTPEQQEQKDKDEEAAKAAAGAPPEKDADGNDIVPPAPVAADVVAATESLNEVPGLLFNEADGTIEITDAAAFIGAFKTIQKTVSGLQKSTKFAEITGKCEKMRLTKANPSGVLTPLNFAEVRDFALALNETQQAKFLTIVGKFKSIGGQIGSGLRPVTETGAAAKITKFSEITDDNEMVKYFCEKLGQNKEQAKQSAKSYYERKQGNVIA